ncbi:hypothetical protein N9E91_03575 [Alphaproteobacteria bacterium]|nr:hypothetical protein [Alphaproteobacteria bacterium]
MKTSDGYISKADVEQAAIDQWMKLNYSYKDQVDADPDGKAPERAVFGCNW